MSKPRKGRQRQATDTGDLLHLTTQLGIRDWDLLVIADGSGSDWHRPCGWCCATILRDSGERRLFVGGANGGTAALAELLPILHALLWFTHAPGPGPTLRHQVQRPLRIHIVTDNLRAVEISQQLAQAETVNGLRNYAPIWHALHSFQTTEYTLHWHWVPRQTFALNVLTDLLSKEARKAVVSPTQICNTNARSQSRVTCSPKESADWDLRELLYGANPPAPPAD